MQMTIMLYTRHAPFVGGMKQNHNQQTDSVRKGGIFSDGRNKTTVPSIFSVRYVYLSGGLGTWEHDGNAHLVFGVDGGV